MKYAAQGGKGFTSKEWDRFESGDGRHWYFAMHNAYLPIYAKKHGQFSKLIMDSGLKLAAVAGCNANRELVDGGPNHRFVTCNDIWHPITNSNPNVKAGAGNADYSQRLDFLLSLVKNVEYYGMRSLICIQGSPDWTHPGFINDIKRGRTLKANDHKPTVEKYGKLYPGPQYAIKGHWLYPPDHWQDWRDFAKAMAEKLKNRGVIYEIINEINVSAQGAVIGGYKAVEDWVTNFYQPAKAVDPSCEVIIGSCDKMLAGMVADGILKNCDGVAIHGYSGNLTATRGIVESGGKKMHIWMTEGHGLRPEYKKTTRGTGKWTVFSVFRSVEKLNDHKLIQVRDAEGNLATNKYPAGKGDRVTIKKDLEYDKRTPLREKYNYYSLGFHTGRFARNNIDGTAKGTDRISARVIFSKGTKGEEKGNAGKAVYGKSTPIYLTAVNNSKTTFHNVRLWPVGFVDNLGFTLKQVRDKDKTIEVFAPGERVEIRMDVTPTTTLYKAAGTYQVGLAIVNQEGKHSLVLKPLTIVAGAGDNNPPVIADSKIKASNDSYTQIALEWAKASDGEGTHANNLIYKLYLSRKANIGNIHEAEINGRLLDTLTDKDTYIIRNLKHSNTYYVNILVKDSEENKSCYKMVECKTKKSKYTTPPEPGDSGNIQVRKATKEEVFEVFDHPDPCAPKLSWKAAKSKGASQDKSSIVYEVYRSEKGNLRSLADIRKNGQQLTTLKDKTDFVVIGLSPRKSYYFNIIATDIFGNESSYKSVVYKTP